MVRMPRLVYWVLSRFCRMCHSKNHCPKPCFSRVINCITFFITRQHSHEKGMIFSLLVTKISNYVTIFSFILDARLKLVAIMANKKYKIRNRKRKFRCNQSITTATDQYTAAHNVTQRVNNEEINCSTSKRKLKHISEKTRLAETECNSFLFFMHLKQLQ